MGRWQTGAQTCEGSKRIELNDLIKRGYLVKGAITEGQYYWTRGGEKSGEIFLISTYTEKEKSIRLIYTLTDRTEQKEYDYDYKIYLTTVPSNLGKGEVLYFLCPVTGKRCRVLYCAYGYHKWKSREAYNHRLYYRSQTQSKMDYANSRYWALDRQINNIMTAKYFRYTHNGQLTRKTKHLESLKAKQNHWDYERWQPKNVPKCLRHIYDKFM